ncbi:MAG: hypothetical protein ACQEVA_14295 [Myxococcota bacterium]
MLLRRWRYYLVALAAFSLLAGGCSGDDGENNTGQDAGEDIVDDDADDDAGDTEADGDGLTDEQRDCDSLMTERCALPWPSNKFLAEDTSMETGYRLQFGETSLIENTREQRASPDIFDHLDGYSVGSAILTVFPNVDISNMAGQRDMGVSVEDTSQTVILELDDSGSVVQRIPHWAEFDDNWTEGDDPADEQTLFLRPGVILKEGTRYVVAFRNLEDTDGNNIERSAAFQKLIDGETGEDPALEPRQARFDEVFSALESEGFDKASLTLAWDFVTYSSSTVHNRMLEARDRGFDITGESGPEMTITEVKEQTEEEDDYWWLEIEGTFETPNFIDFQAIDGVNGPMLNLDENGDPIQNTEEPTRDVDFWIRVPHSAKDGSDHGLIQYGHGLLGEGSQVDGSFNGKIANDYNFIFFASSLAGMESDDVGNALKALQHVGLFPFMADRLHQGMLEFLLLARSMRERFPGLTEVTDKGISVNTDELFYSGISQGGIFGGTYLALSTDVTYGHLGVPGNNYSMLLQRSVDFNTYFNALRTNYPATIDQTLALEIIQLLWDQTDPVTYLRHITAEPFEGNDPHYGLFAPAKGDYQVAVVTNEIAARSDIDIKLMENYGRDVYGVTPEPYPYTGSGVVLYDFGNPWPDVGNTPPSDDLGDPHGKPRRADHHNEQMIHFFRNGGEIIDVCGGDGCTPQ